MNNIWFIVDDADLANAQAEWKSKGYLDYGSNKHFKKVGTTQLFSTWGKGDPVATIQSVENVAPSAIQTGLWDAATGVRQPAAQQDPSLLDYMPDVWNGDEPPTYSPATEITDRIFLSGQQPRDFE